MAGSALSMLGLLALIGLTPLLSSHLFCVTRVRARFTTVDEMKAKTELNAQAGKPTFEALYAPVDLAKVDCYLAPRQSLAFLAISFLSEMSHSAKPPASRDNFLPAPPAPEAMCYVDETNVQSLEVPVAQYLVRWMQVATCAAIAVFGASSLLIKRHIGDLSNSAGSFVGNS